MAWPLVEEFFFVIIEFTVSVKLKIIKALKPGIEVGSFKPRIYPGKYIKYYPSNTGMGVFITALAIFTRYMIL